jgi:hypothetical protein
VNIQNTIVQDRINDQIQKLVGEDIGYYQNSLDFSYQNVGFLNPKVISMGFGRNSVSFDMTSGDRIRLRDIVDVKKLSMIFWEIAQDESYAVYYKEFAYYVPDIVEVHLPDLSTKDLLKYLECADDPKNSSSARSYFYYDGLGVALCDDFSAFISFEDIKHILKHDYWSEYVLQNGYIPSVNEYQYLG